MRGKVVHIAGAPQVTAVSNSTAAPKGLNKFHRESQLIENKYSLREDLETERIDA